MDAIQSIGTGQVAGAQQGSAISAQGATAGGAMAASAMSYSSMSVSMTSRVETFMAQYGGDRVEQLVRAMILLLILLQMMGDRFEEDGPEMLLALGDQFASGGQMQMAAASYQAVSLVQNSVLQVSSGGMALSGAVAGADAGQAPAAQQLDVVA